MGQREDKDGKEIEPSRGAKLVFDQECINSDVSLFGWLFLFLNKSIIFKKWRDMTRQGPPPHPPGLEDLSVEFLGS